MSLTAFERAGITSARDLLVNGTAYETPLSEDVIQRLSPVVDSLGFGFPGKSNYEVARDMPVSALIGLVWACGINRWTLAEATALVGAITYMGLSTATETPFAEDVIQRIAPAAASSGFKTVGGFYEAVKDAPVSTMLNWALFIGA